LVGLKLTSMTTVPFSNINKLVQKNLVLFFLLKKKKYNQMEKLITMVISN